MRLSGSRHLGSNPSPAAELNATMLFRKSFCTAPYAPPGTPQNRKMFLVISVFRNHEELKYPYGYWAKERFQLCGQLFEGQKVHFLRIVQGLQNEARLRKMPTREVWKTEVPQAIA